MAKVRCAGCGRSGGPVGAMERHVVACPAYAELFAADPARALDPRREYERWISEEASPDARAQAKDVRIQAVLVGMDQRRDAAARRWAPPPDPLADDED